MLTDPVFLTPDFDILTTASALRDPPGPQGQFVLLVYCLQFSTHKNTPVSRIVRLSRIYYDQLDKKEKTVTTVTAKPELREAMQEAKMGFRKLRFEMDFNCCTLTAALAGKTISLEYAERLAACLGRSTTSLFNVTKRKEPYAYETIHFLVA